MDVLIECLAGYRARFLPFALLFLKPLLFV